MCRGEKVITVMSLYEIVKVHNSVSVYIIAVYFMKPWNCYIYNMSIYIYICNIYNIYVYICNIDMVITEISDLSIFHLIVT